MKQRLDKHFLLNRAFVGTLLAIAVPIALQNMISFGVAVMDSVMLGSFGDVAIAAANLGGQPFSILMSFGFGLSSGGSVLIAQYWGKGDIGRIRKVMRISMQLVFLASLGITVVCLLMPEGILRIFTKDEAIGPGGRRLSGAGGVFVYSVQPFQQLYDEPARRGKGEDLHGHLRRQLFCQCVFQLCVYLRKIRRAEAGGAPARPWARSLPGAASW